MDNPKVSIIMGVFNSENTISQCIESVLAQTYTNWEFIICDDCSTDKSYSIAKSYADQFPEKIILLQNIKNLKLAATLNKCIKFSSGEYIARMDSDDMCMSDRLEVQVRFLENNKEYGVVGSGSIPFDDEGARGVCIPNEIPVPKDLIFGPPHIHPTVIFRKEVVEALGGYSESNKHRRCEDLELWFRYYSKGYLGYNIQKPLIYYREGYTDYKRRKVKDSIATFKTMVDGYRLNNIPIYLYPLAAKPILSAMVPRKVIFGYHNIRLKGVYIKKHSTH